MNAQTDTRKRSLIRPVAAIPMPSIPTSAFEAPTFVYVAGTGIGIGCGALIVLVLLGTLGV
jgi:hypothetical protein